MKIKIPISVANRTIAQTKSRGCVRLFLCMFAIASLLAVPLQAGQISPEGKALAEKYDAMDVEHHWLAGRRVDWQSGEPSTGKPGKTHCSAFVAAACERLGIYILRPPQHGQIHPASAQAEWLKTDGQKEKWSEVKDPFKAQALANEGKVVVVAYPSPDPEKPGHIALVRPSDKSDDLIRSEGPQIIQAGKDNKNSTSLKEGFRNHKEAWISADKYAVTFFVQDPRRRS